MRISNEIIHAIHFSLNKFLITHKFEVFLYGSRTNDSLKGGDIDLLVITSIEGKSVFEKYNLDILVDLKKNPHIGDRRIDLKAATLHDLQTNVFLKTISTELVKI